MILNNISEPPAFTSQVLASQAHAHIHAQFQWHWGSNPERGMLDKPSAGQPHPIAVLDDWGASGSRTIPALA